MSKIEWTGKTWNPIVGCSPAKGSEQGGCRECYAQGQVHRFGERYRSAAGLVRLNVSKRDALTFLPETPNGKTLGKGAKWTGEVWLLPEVLTIPLKRRKATTYFVNSLADLFHGTLVDSDEGRLFIAAIFGVMAATPQHRYQILTKWPEKALEWFAWVERRRPGLVPTYCREQASILGADGSRYTGEWKRWPLSNTWIGTSVENQATADARIPELRKVPAAIRFLSCEPLLGPTRVMPGPDEGAWLKARDDGRLWHRDEPGVRGVGGTWSFGGGIDWIIAGGESGPKARPMHPDWAMSLRDQCVSAGVPFFFKQWGEWAPEVQPNRGPKVLMSSDGSLLAAGKRYMHECVLSPDNIFVDGNLALEGKPGRVVLAKYGKGTTGRELDGRTWDEYPDDEHNRYFEFPEVEVDHG